MNIRHAEKRDLDSILEINNSESKWVGLEERSFFEDYLHAEDFYVVTENNKVCAFILALKQDEEYESRNFQWFREKIPEFNYIDRVVVEKDNRRKGIATKLYNLMIRKSKELPIVCEVSVNPENSESIIFHDRFGFKGIGYFSSDGKKTCRMYKRD